MAEERTIKIAPYGSWESPVSAALVAAGAMAMSFPSLVGKDTYWVESRPAEGGRQTLVRALGGGQIEELVPAPYNVRTRVHEYGGLSYAIHAGRIYFANFSDQRLYVMEPGGAPTPLTPEAPLRYADLHIDAGRGRLLCVQEDHSQAGQEATNRLVSLRLEDGDGTIVLAQGHNFYAAPALSPDGKQLAWLAWSHPNMPWDETELWLGELDQAGQVISSRKVAGGAGESIAQPAWSPQGELYYVAEKTGWWNLYRLRDGEEQVVYPLEAEFARPHWVFGVQMYDFTPQGEIICAYVQKGASQLAQLDPQAGWLALIETGFNYHIYVHTAAGRAFFMGGAPERFISAVEIDLASGEQRILRQTRALEVERAYISTPLAVEFPTEGGQTAHGFFYPPANPDFQAPEGEKPPLIVISHGGPTSQTTPVLSMSTQFWTSRGFGVLDVNYGGSTGYGREYRERLKGQWGVVDVDDAVNGAEYLVAQGLVDGERLVIRGGSAGGYTTLAALTFRKTFKAGASHFGIGDLTVFVHDTHKFESRYMDSLIGPYPERKDLYEARSPLFHMDRLNCPVILLQGLEDKIVPPNQAEMMFDALKKKGLPVAYLPFEGEQHGFRKAETIQRALEAEYYFYAKVFGFEPAGEIEPVQIENLM